MLKHFPNRECWWIAENNEQLDLITKLNVPVVLANTDKANLLFSTADVYVVENNRENYPKVMNPGIKVLNLWHGVGLKRIEFGVDQESGVSDSIVRKNIKNNAIYKRNMLFLTTSAAMEKHFKNYLKLSDEQFIRGSYPRNIVYNDRDILTFNKKTINNKNLSEYNRIYFFAPTWRNEKYGYSFSQLLPDLSRVADILQAQGDLLIIKPHPLTTRDSSYLATKALFLNNKNILFIENEIDVYEIFDKIDIGIIDYSSIYYDMLAAGINKFIRYIPDYALHIEKEPLVLDYMEYTDGPVAADFDQLCELIKSTIVKNEKNDILHDFFFGFSHKPIDAYDTDAVYEEINNIVVQTENKTLSETRLKSLYSFDVFDTLIKRNTLSPISIFHKVQDRLKKKEKHTISNYVIDNYVKIRRECEADVRENMRKTLIERASSKLEITFSQIFKRMQEIHNLSSSDVDYLMQEEISAELEAVEPILERINLLQRHLDNGDDVILISDMYLPYDIIRKMLTKASPVLSNIPLYVSAEVGHQKSTGQLYKHIFFDIDYVYGKWVHFGDNRHADSEVPKRFGIKPFKHDMDSYVALEKYIVDASPRYDHYQVATAMQRYRQALLNGDTESYDEVKYFGYSYFGSFIVPYLDWVINDAISRKYKTLYFISRDGYFLKEAADIIIKNKNLDLKTNIIYASRRTWRLATPENHLQTEFFSDYGSFAAISSFAEVVSASQFSEEVLLGLVPELASYAGRLDLTKDEIHIIASLMFNSKLYRQHLSDYKSDYSERVIKYLNQVINFDETYAFVEFWGRGYAQDLMTETMAAAAGRAVDNPFYYVRCLRENHGHSIRHRFTNRPINFWFVEPIFAATPYKSVSEYHEVDGIVTPYIVPTENEFHNSLMVGVCRFAEDYSKLSVEDTNYLNRSISDLAYTYYANTPSDQYICNVFARFKDNTGVYQEIKETAPILEISDLHEKEIDNLSRALKISLARSTPTVRKTFEKIANEKGIKYTLPEPRKMVFPLNGTDRYSFSTKSQQLIYNLTNNELFCDTRFSEIDKIDVSLSKNTFDIADTVWTASGIPRFAVELGFVTAHKSHTRIISHIVFLADVAIYTTEQSLSPSLPTGIPLAIDYAIRKEGLIYIKTDAGTFPITSNSSCLLFSNNSLVVTNSICKILITDLENTAAVAATDYHAPLPRQIDIHSASIDGDSNIIIHTENGDLVYDNDKMKFVVSNIDDYLHKLDDGILIARKDLDIYTSPILNESTKFKISASTLIQPKNLLWTSHGITVIECKHGYLPALKNNFYPGTIQNTSDIDNSISYDIRVYDDGRFHICSNYRLNSSLVTNERASTQLTKILINNDILDINCIQYDMGDRNVLSQLSGRITDSQIIVVTDAGNFQVEKSTIFVCCDIGNYFTSLNFGYFIATNDMDIFIDRLCTTPSSSTYTKNDVLEVQELVWTPSGWPSFKTNVGYVVPLTSKLRSLSTKEISEIILQEISSSSFYLNESVEIFDSVDMSSKNGASLVKGTVLNVNDVLINNGSIILKVNNQGFIPLERGKLSKCRSDIVNYHHTLSANKFITLKKTKIYSDLNFKKPIEITYPKGKVFTPTEILWSDGGTPRFKINEGYISTNTSFVTESSFHKNFARRISSKLNSVFKGYK